MPNSEQIGASALSPVSSTEPIVQLHPLRVLGKFLVAGDEKLYIKGVTYGTFKPDVDGIQFPGPEVVRRDFAMMAANGINAIRTYTVPPRWLLESLDRR